MVRIFLTGDSPKIHAEIFDPGRGKHLWMMMALYRLADPSAIDGGKVIMDTENLMTIEGPGCYKCEAMWSREIQQSHCRGRM